MSVQQISPPGRAADEIDELVNWQLDRGIGDSLHVNPLFELLPDPGWNVKYPDRLSNAARWDGMWGGVTWTNTWHTSDYDD